MEIDPAELSAVCSACGAELWALRGDQWSLKSSMLKLRRGIMVARCPTNRCKQDIPIPWLTLQTPRQRLVIRQKSR